GGVDADDPQSAELALAHAPIAKGINPATNQRDQRLTVKVVPAEAETLGQLPHTFPAAKDGLAAACPCHDLILPSRSAPVCRVPCFRGPPISRLEPGTCRAAKACHPGSSVSLSL